MVARGKNRTPAEKLADLKAAAAELELKLEEAKRREMEKLMTTAGPARLEVAEKVYELLGIEPQARDRKERKRAALAIEALDEMFGVTFEGADEIEIEELEAPAQVVEAKPEKASKKKA